MTTQDIQMIIDAITVMTTFGFVDGVFYCLGALKLIDLLYDFFDWFMSRISRYLKRAA